MARIKTIDYKEATDGLKEIYDGLIKSRGQLANVHTIQSLRPLSIVAHMGLYMEIMYSKSDLSRAERELIASVVSISNSCKYCTIHHTQALNKYWKDDKKIEKLKQGLLSDILTQKELLLVEYAKTLTLNLDVHIDNDATLPLKKSGFSDAAILDLVLVISYFNFVNRIVVSLGVEIEDDNGSNYKY